MIGIEHTHRQDGQALRHIHPGGERNHGYFEHHEDGCHITCDHEDPGERVVTMYTLPGTSPAVVLGVTERGAVLVGERLGAIALDGVNWISRLAVSTPVDAWQDTLEQVRVEQAQIQRQVLPSPLRAALREDLSHGMLTLAQLEGLNQGTGRRVLIGELARMRDDGEVEVTGSRYKLTTGQA